MHVVRVAAVAAVVGAFTLRGFQLSAQEPERVPLDGESVYLGHCAACHGAGGKGDGPAAEAMKRKPTDLTAIARNNKGMFPRRTIEDVVVNGGRWKAHGSDVMPVWGPVFQLAHADEKIITARLQNLILYLESIQAP